MKKIDHRRHLNYRIGDRMDEQRFMKKIAKKTSDEHHLEQLRQRRSDIQITPKKISRWLNE